MDDGSVHWPYFTERKEEVASALGSDLSWEPLEGSKASRLAVYLGNVDPDDGTAWPSYRGWAIEQLGRFRSVFQPIVMLMP